jgi:hypothetical protein
MVEGIRIGQMAPKFGHQIMHFPIEKLKQIMLPRIQLILAHVNVELFAKMIPCDVTMSILSSVPLAVWRFLPF